MCWHTEAFIKEHYQPFWWSVWPYSISSKLESVCKSKWNLKISNGVMAATTSYVNRHCPGKSVSQLWVQQTIKLVLVWLDFSWIEQVLKFTLQKAAQGWQQIVPMLFLPDTWEISQKGWVQGTHQGPTSKFNVISAFLFVCLSEVKEGTEPPPHFPTPHPRS